MSNRSMIDVTLPSDPAHLATFEQLRDFAVDDKLSSLELSPALTSRDRAFVRSIARKMGFRCSTTELHDDQKFLTLFKPGAGVQIPPKSQETLTKSLREFVEDDTRQELAFPKSLTSEERRYVHELAQSMSLRHDGMGMSSWRYVLVSKQEPRVVERNNQDKKRMAAYLDQYREHLTNSTDCITESLVDLRVASWNIQRMDELFQTDTTFFDEVIPICVSITELLNNLRADILTVQEGPRSATRLRKFVDKFLNNEYEVFGGFGPETVRQKPYILVRRACKAIGNLTLHHELNAFMNKTWEYDSNGDLLLEPHDFIRSPVFIEVEVCISSKRTSKLVIGSFHLKGEHSGTGRKAWTSGDPAKKREFVSNAVKNRRTVSAESTRIRQGLVDVLFKGKKHPLVILGGDMNNGPGEDVFERCFQLPDCTLSLVGSPFRHQNILHPLLTKERWVPYEDQWTVQFHDYVEKIPSKRALTDHLLVSNELKGYVVRAAVDHTHYNALSECPPSDHRPVFVDFQFISPANQKL